MEPMSLENLFRIRPGNDKTQILNGNDTFQFAPTGFVWKKLTGALSIRVSTELCMATEEAAHREKKWTDLIMEKANRASTRAENTPRFRK